MSFLRHIKYTAGSAQDKELCDINYASIVNDSKLVLAGLRESIQAYYGIQETTVSISSTADQRGADLLTSPAPR